MKKTLVFLLSFGILASTFVGSVFAKYAVYDTADAFGSKISVKVPTTRHYIETKSWFNSGDPSEHVYVYAFKETASGTRENAEFPGLEATYQKDIDNTKKLFYYDIPQTFDKFVVSKVVNDVALYQTVDIDISSLSGDNCIYLNTDSGSSAIPVGHYNYALRLSENSGTITAGNSTTITFDRNLNNVSASVSPSGATVSVNNESNSATISSSTVGSYTITFSDDVNEANYTLTVNAAITYRTQYIETKSWFNSGASNEHVYVYAFKNGANPAQENHAWPGEEATYVREIGDGKKLFVFNIPDTYDTFIVSKVVDNQGAVYQTVNISISTLGSDNCIYLNADYGSSSIPVGHYNVIP